MSVQLLLQLRSRAHGSWVQAPHRALCRERGACLGFSLCPSPLLPLSLSQNKYTLKDKDRESTCCVYGFHAWELPLTEGKGRCGTQHGLSALDGTPRKGHGAGGPLGEPSTQRAPKSGAKVSIARRCFPGAPETYVIEAIFIDFTEHGNNVSRAERQLRL